MATPEQQEILDAFREAAPDLEILMPERCTILGPGTATQTPSGSVRRTATVRAEDVPCRVASAGSGTQAERLIADRLAVVEGYIVTLPLDTTVDEKDRLKVGARTFEIVSIPVTTYQVSVRCICREVQ